MAMDQEARTEALDQYKLMSADELSGMLGDDAEHDALINEVLAGGKAVTVKGQSADDEHSGQAGTHHSMGAGDDDDEQDDDADADDDADDEAVPEVDAAAPVAEAPAAADPVADAAAAAAPAPAAEPEVTLPPPDLSGVDAMFADKMTALHATKADALAKLMGGEIDAAEYSKIESQYELDRDFLKDQKRETVAWVGEIHEFQKQALKDTGINYATDDAKADALDEWVKRIAAKHPDQHRLQTLEQAHKKVMLEFEVAPKAAPAPAAAAPAAPAKPEKKGRAPDLSGIPPTLGSLPAASNPGSGDGGEFAHINNLTGMDFERALARLTPDQQARYLAE